VGQGQGGTWTAPGVSGPEKAKKKSNKIQKNRFFLKIRTILEKAATTATTPGVQGPEKAKKNPQMVFRQTDSSPTDRSPPTTKFEDFFGFPMNTGVVAVVAAFSRIVPARGIPVFVACFS
jgi:hypothetical protein